MKKILFGISMMGMLALTSLSTPEAEALSCLPVADYLERVVGDEEIVIFVATATDQASTSEYMSETLTVTETLQGSVEKTLVVYHERNQVWGYLCNQGPKGLNESGVYIAGRDEFGKYNVYQRLPANDPLVKTLRTDLKEAEVTGTTTETTTVDRKNQLITTIKDLMRQIEILMAEYKFWGTKN